MKKINILIAIFLSLILSISNVYADDISISKVEVFDSSDSSAKVTASNLTVVPEVTFNNVGDYVILKITFKGSNLDKYKIKSITDNNDNDYVKITYDYKGTLSDQVFMVIGYKTKTDSKVSLNDITMNMSLVNEDSSGPSTRSSYNPDDLIDEPPRTGTLSHILTPIILIAMAVFLLKYYLGHKNDTTLMMLIMCLLLIPVSVMATESKQLKIIVRGSKIVVNGESSSPETGYYLTINANGGTLSGNSRVTYTDQISKTELDKKVSKSGCTVEYWHDDNIDKNIYQYADDEQNGHTLTANWNCSGGSGSGKKILLMAGHSYEPYCAEFDPSDCRSGKTDAGYSEPEETRLLVQSLKEQLIAVGYPSNAIDIANELLGENFNDKSTTREVYIELRRKNDGKANNLSKINFSDYAFAIEFHFNAAGNGALTTAEGTGAVCARIAEGSSTPNCGSNKAISGAIKEAVRGVLNNTDRGFIAYNATDIKYMNSINLPFVYLETEFYDNKTAMATYKARQTQVARAIAEVIKQYYPYS